jgi:Holliday junction resolvase-like predicted endonuclease
MFKMIQGVKEALIALLKLTSEKSTFNVKQLAENSLLTFAEASNFLQELTSKNLVSIKDGIFEVSPTQRMLLAVESVRFGVSPCNACKYLSWREFEQAVERILKLNGYCSILHLKIKVKGKLSEIDIFALKGYLALAIDCKNWKRPLKNSNIKKIVKKQLERVESLQTAENIKILKVKVGRISSLKITVIPVIVTLFEATYKIYEGTPIVPVSKLASFLHELYVCLDILSCQEINLKL